MIEAKQMQNLTLPISAYFPVGSVFPWDSPYYTEDIATIERNRAHLFYISMGSGTGTRRRASEALRVRRCGRSVWIAW